MPTSDILEPGIHLVHFNDNSIETSVLEKWPSSVMLSKIKESRLEVVELSNDCVIHGTDVTDYGIRPVRYYTMINKQGKWQKKPVFDN